MGQSESTQEARDYGEHNQQTNDRYKVEQLCRRIQVDDYGGDLLESEQIELDGFKKKCDVFKSYQAEIKKEMNARRKSGYGNPIFYGHKHLDGILHESDGRYLTPEYNYIPIVSAERDFRSAVETRKRKEAYDRLMKEP